MAIVECVLPIKDGYVERVTESGRHYYEPLPSEKRMLSIEADAKLHDAQIQASSDRADFLEECLVEMANIIYGE